MFHNDYQSINKNRLRNEIPWNTMFHAPFSDVPRNVPRTDCAIKWSSLFPFFAPIPPIHIKQFFQLIAPYNIYVRACARKKAGYTLLFFSVGHY